MRKLNVRVFDDFVTGTATTVFTASEFNESLGAQDRLTVFAVSDSTTGTAPTLTVQIQHSSDERNWVNKNGTAEINAVSLSLSNATVAAANDSTGNYGCGFVRLAITLGGATPVTHLRVWVTGRDST